MQAPLTRSITQLLNPKPAKQAHPNQWLIETSTHTHDPDSVFYMNPNILPAKAHGTREREDQPACGQQGCRLTAQAYGP
jgi:predicted adenine nucleotide alpha hydrolase (AANH) superfamily ATPase